MSVWIWILIVAGIVVLVTVAALAWIRRRTERLRSQFGPEYERAVEEGGGRWQGESELEERRKRRASLDIRPLDPSARQRYVGAWREVQARFVDSPESALADADRLVTQVMQDRGYPMQDFERRAADVSVDHPNVVQNYRQAGAIRDAHRRGAATTEELRQAMVHYRALFDEMLEGETGTAREAR
jgi:hypothetical protein